MFKITIIAILLFTTNVLAAPEIKLFGAGSTFAQPIIQRWSVEYQKLHPNILVDYQGTGSGAGLKAITDKTVAFAGTDAPVSRKDIEAMGGEQMVLQIPVCVGAVVPAYNLPGILDLRLTGEVLGDIYLGKINKWNDAKIANINPGVNLPNIQIIPAWRTDGSGTTFVFTNYLATQNKLFKSTIGAGKQVSWPVGQGGKGNPGVAAIVQQTIGTIGYVEHTYAIANNLNYGSIKNKNGAFIKAIEENISIAGEDAANSMKGQILEADLWNQTGDKVYPVASFTYIVAYLDMRHLNKLEERKALADFLWWITHDGQKIASSIGYATLSNAVQKKVEVALHKNRSAVMDFAKTEY